MKTGYSVFVEKLEGLSWKTVKTIYLDNCKTQEEAMIKRTEIKKLVKASGSRQPMRALLIEMIYDETIYDSQAEAFEAIM